MLAHVKRSYALKVQKSIQNITPFAGVYFTNEAFNRKNLLKTY